LPLSLSDNTKETCAPPDVKLVKLLPQICVSLVPLTDLVPHSAYVTLATMKMVPPVLLVEWNVKPVITLIPVLLVLVTELDQKMDVLAHMVISISVRHSVQLAQINVLIVTWMVFVVLVLLTEVHHQIVVV